LAENYKKIRQAEDDIESLKQDFLKALREIKEAQSAVRYFSRVEKWVAESSYLRAQEDPVWRVSLAATCKAVLNSYLQYWDFLGRESKNLGIDLQERYRPGDDAYWMMQGMVKIEYPQHWAEQREEFHERRLSTIGFDDEDRLDRLREGQVRSEKMTTERWIAVAFGFIFITALLVLTVMIENPTPMQETTFRIVLALASGAIGAVIPGILNLQGKLGGFTVRAAGALALFFIVYFWNPAISGESSPATPSETVTEEQ